MLEGAAGRVDRIGRERVGTYLSSKAPIRHLDPILLATAFLLTAFGSVMVWSASSARLRDQGLPEDFLFQRQLVFSAVGFGVMVVAATFSYRRLKAWGPLLYVGGLATLGLVLVPGIGSRVAGAQRWISFGFFQMQPAEFMKLGVIAVLALVLSERRSEPTWIDALKTVAIAGAPAALIYVQPDLGTLLVLIVVAVAALVVAGTRLRVLVVMLALGVAGTVAVLNLGLLQEYQVARLTAFLDPGQDLDRTGYNLNQARIGVGSGGMTGTGLFAGTQTNLDFVPEVHTDFIFVAVGEELGFVGATLLLGLFAVFLWRAVRIAVLSKDLFGTLLASGVVAMIAFQMFINIGMTIGVSPITGIPLPFVSFGGSSLVTTYAATGILLNVHMRRFV
ncbi:MAG TPA: rod shape-determining protein RodA [Actinomycetota bacterium]